MKKYIIAGLAVTMIAPAAHAATLTQSESIALQQTNWSETFGFEQFDPSMGSLTSVVFQFSGLVNGSAFAENLSTNEITADLNLEAEMTATVGGFTSVLGFVIPGATETVTLGRSDGTVDFGGSSGVSLTGLNGTDDDERTFTSALAPFIGTGNVTVDVAADASSSAGGGGNIVTQFLTDASAEGTIIYDYEPISSVPLPAGAWMMLAALGALVGFRRYAKS